MTSRLDTKVKTVVWTAMCQKLKVKVFLKRQYIHARKKGLCLNQNIHILHVIEIYSNIILN